MEIKRIICLLLLTFSLSCKNEKPQYFYFNFSEKEVTSLSIDGEIKEGRENGSWSICSGKNGEAAVLLSKGNFINGLKEGIWLYNLYGDIKDSVDWGIYNNEQKSIVLNLPKDWEVIDYNDVFFTAVFKSKSPINKTKYFVILTQNADDGQGLEEYYQMNLTELKNTYKIYSQELFLLRSAGKEYYFSIFSVEKEGESILLLNFLATEEGQIFDFTYSSLKEDEELKKNLFLDIVKGTYFKGNRLLDPFENLRVVQIGIDETILPEEIGFKVNPL